MCTVWLQSIILNLVSLSSPVSSTWLQGSRNKQFPACSFSLFTQTQTSRKWLAKCFPSLLRQPQPPSSLSRQIEPRIKMIV
ncbi:hypothetical protein B0T18DRAFT_411807, partial [Schizothecium vesticola]